MFVSVGRFAALATHAHISMRRFIVALFVLALAACAGDDESLPTLDPETERLIEQGRIVGFVAESGAHVWRGIPFAKSTAGDNRWRAPQPSPGWEGVRETVQFAERCAQVTNAFDVDEGLKPGLVVGSEDCLALNIFAPPNAQNASLPVMVWIHGGGNVWGKSSDYDGSRLAVNENVVVIAVQYRVGPLGWFAHEAIRESAVTPHDAAASFAILDLIASLEWVRDNISVFGGDPKHVTIFGESAGGHNVAVLLASPLSEGLFHRAILQSGFFDSVSLAEAEGLEGARENPSLAIAARLNVETAEDLRALPVETLLRAYDAAGDGYMEVPRMIQDGVVLPTTPLREAFRNLDMFHNVPIMTGTNRDEMKLFYFGDERLTKKFLWLFVTARDQQFYDALSEYVTRAWRIRAVDGPASMMTAAGHQDVYAYRFDWDDSGQFLFMNFRALFGAAHGLDIPFLFNNFEFFGRANNIIFNKKSKVDREHLSRAMGRYWASFARDGVPSSVGAPDWPTYGEKAAFLRLDTDNDGGIEVMHGADSFEKIATDLEKDPRLDQESRCIVVEEIGKWMWLFDEPAYAEIKTETGCDEA